MQNDINTYGYTQWFYFRVTNTFKGKKVFFNILNFVIYSFIELDKNGFFV